MLLFIHKSSDLGHEHIWYKRRLLRHLFHNPCRDQNPPDVWKREIFFLCSFMQPGQSLFQFYPRFWEPGDCFVHVVAPLWVTVQGGHGPIPEEKQFNSVCYVSSGRHCSCSFFCVFGWEFLPGGPRNATKVEQSIQQMFLLHLSEKADESHRWPLTPAWGQQTDVWNLVLVISERQLAKGIAASVGHGSAGQPLPLVLETLSRTIVVWFCSRFLPVGFFPSCHCCLSKVQDLCFSKSHRGSTDCNGL